jgi:hypothetical protein
MAGIVERVARFLGGLPGRLVRAALWAHMEPAGLGAGKVHTEDLDELERQRRQDDEILRREDDSKS